jgi:hypothetical protein
VVHLLMSRLATAWLAWSVLATMRWRKLVLAASVGVIPLSACTDVGASHTRDCSHLALAVMSGNDALMVPMRGPAMSSMIAEAPADVRVSIKGACSDQVFATIGRADNRGNSLRGVTPRHWIVRHAGTYVIRFHIPMCAGSAEDACRGGLAELGTARIVVH